VDIGQMTNLGMIEGFWKGNPLIDLTPTTQACMVSTSGGAAHGPKKPRYPLTPTYPLSIM